MGKAGSPRKTSKTAGLVLGKPSHVSAYAHVNSARVSYIPNHLVQWGTLVYVDVVLDNYMFVIYLMLTRRKGAMERANPWTHRFRFSLKFFLYEYSLLEL